MYIFETGGNILNVMNVAKNNNLGKRKSIRIKLPYTMKN